MTEIRMIGLDLDGTLLRRDQTVSEGNLQALRKCVEQGIQIYLISGRPYCFTKMIAQQIHERVKVISSNGGIYEIGTQCIEQWIEPYCLHQIIEVLKGRSMHTPFSRGNMNFLHMNLMMNAFCMTI